MVIPEPWFLVRCPFLLSQSRSISSLHIPYKLVLRRLLLLPDAPCCLSRLISSYSPSHPIPTSCPLYCLFFFILINSHRLLPYWVGIVSSLHFLLLITFFSFSPPSSSSSSLGSHFPTFLYFLVLLFIPRFPIFFSGLLLLPLSLLLLSTYCWRLVPYLHIALSYIQVHTFTDGHHRHCIVLRHCNSRLCTLTFCITSHYTSENETIKVYFPLYLQRPAPISDFCFLHIYHTSISHLRSHKMKFLAVIPLAAAVSANYLPKDLKVSSQSKFTQNLAGFQMHVTNSLQNPFAMLQRLLLAILCHFTRETPVLTPWYVPKRHFLQ